MGTKSVDDIFSKLNFTKELNQLREIILQTEVEETIKWGMPVYTAHGQNIIGIGAFKSHFGLWFFQGALLSDAHKFLVNAQEGKTRAMRQWRMIGARDIKAKLIKEYINEAIANAQKGKQIKATQAPRKAPEIEGALGYALESSKKLKDAFRKLSPAKQKEYYRYVQEAKRESTRDSRIEKIRPLILEGKGLNDKYR